jgi:hypothetical protein
MYQMVLDYLEERQVPPSWNDIAERVQGLGSGGAVSSAVSSELAKPETRFRRLEGVGHRSLVTMDNRMIVRRCERHIAVQTIAGELVDRMGNIINVLGGHGIDDDDFKKEVATALLDATSDNEIYDEIASLLFQVNTNMDKQK